MDILFLGATGTVTGSKFLVGAGSRRILVDCGMFQGYKQLRERNWRPLPVDPADFDGVVLTHAHVDHSGWLPVLCRRGYRGPVYATQATADLCDILLRDSARLHEEEAEYANRKRFTKHQPAQPLFTEADAEEALGRFEIVDYHARRDLGDGVGLELTPSGHILGSAFVSIFHANRHLLFSGDLGRPGLPLMRDPEKLASCDWLVLESTYGKRDHAKGDPRDQIGDAIGRVLGRGGTVVIPSFAVARAQSVILHVQELKEAHRIPDVPVYLNSPMALNVTKLYVKHHDEHRLSEKRCEEVFSKVNYVRSVEESKRLNANQESKIIISSSGMATGGRVLHHIKAFGSDPRNAIVFVGFQAGGTRGRDMVEGAKTVRIHGQDVPIEAEIIKIDTLSAHADRGEALDWLAGFEKPPRETFLVHGEPDALEGMRRMLRDRLGWRAHVPDYRERVDLEDRAEEGEAAE